jgi:hypothetical protein
MAPAVQYEKRCVKKASKSICEGSKSPKCKWASGDKRQFCRIAKNKTAVRMDEDDDAVFMKPRKRKSPCKGVERNKCKSPCKWAGKGQKRQFCRKEKNAPRKSK